MAQTPTACPDIDYKFCVLCSKHKELEIAFWEPEEGIWLCVDNRHAWTAALAITCFR